MPQDNPFGIAGVSDLAGLVVVLAAPEVPAGRYATEVLNGAAVRPSSFEQSVGAVAAKVALGEADAGIGYFTDTLQNARLDAVRIEGPLALYPAVELTSDGAAFIEFLTGPAAQAILASYGFGAPA